MKFFNKNLELRYSNNYTLINGTVTTQRLRFLDDLQIEFSENRDKVTVDCVSRSRIGQWDFGANENHLKTLISLAQADKQPGYTGYKVIDGCS